MKVSYSRLLILSLLLGSLLAVSGSVDAGQAKYIYDDLGRLSQVIDDQGNVATYTYDAVGNLLSITSSTEEKGTGYFSRVLRGRPRGRSVDSRPVCFTIFSCQSEVPKGA